MLQRLLYNALLFLSIALFPWPMYTALIIAGVFLFRNFYEALAWLVIVEVLFAPSGVPLYQHWYLVSVGIILIISVYTKRVMRWYE